MDEKLLKSREVPPESLRWRCDIENLKFETTDANIIESLDDSVREVSRSDFEITSGGDRPVWFKPLENSQTSFYKNTFFDSPNIFLSYGKDNGLVYFFSMAGD